MENGKIINKMSLDILFNDKLPTDTCSCCRKVYTNEEYEAYGQDNPSMCKQCQIDTLTDTIAKEKMRIVRYVNEGYKEYKR